MSLVRLDALPCLDVDAFFDGDHLVLGGAKLLAAGPLGPGHNAGAIGLHVVDHILDGQLLVVMKLPVVLDDGGLRQHAILHLVVDLGLKLEVHIHCLKVGDRQDDVNGNVSTCESRVSSAQCRAGDGWQFT